MFADHPALAWILLQEKLSTTFVNPSVTGPHDILDSKMTGFCSQDFHVYNDIVRLPSLTTLPCPGPQDLTESALLEVLKRLPSFPPLQRLAGGRYRFGRIEAISTMS